MRTGLSESQVYKWAWDQKKKLTVTVNNQTMPTGNDGSLSVGVPDDAEGIEGPGLTKEMRRQTTATMIGQAEVTRDEFGGYCTKRWGTTGPSQSRDSGAELDDHEMNSSIVDAIQADDGSLC